MRAEHRRDTSYARFENVAFEKRTRLAGPKASASYRPEDDAELRYLLTLRRGCSPGTIDADVPRDVLAECVVSTN